MQHKMRENPLAPEGVNRLLERAMVGRVSTTGSDGYPYTVVVHFVYREGAVYFHGLPKGEKLCNIARDPKVCFEVDELLGIRKEGVTVPCKVGSGYESAVLRGRASLVDDPGEKEDILRAITANYAPELGEAPILPQAAAGTAVVKIQVESCTGKYHK